MLVMYCVAVQFECTVWCERKCDKNFVNAVTLRAQSHACMQANTETSLWYMHMNCGKRVHQNLNKAFILNGKMK